MLLVHNQSPVWTHQLATAVRLPLPQLCLGSENAEAMPGSPLYDRAPGHQSRESNLVSGVTSPVWDDPGPIAPVPGDPGEILGRCSVLCVFVMRNYSIATFAVLFHS